MPVSIATSRIVMHLHAGVWTFLCTNAAAAAAAATTTTTITAATTSDFV